MQKSNSSLVKKFMRGTGLVWADLTFEWRICRFHVEDWNAIEREMARKGLDKKISKSMGTAEEEKCKKQMRDLIAKHTRRWYTYSLYRFCPVREDIVKAICKRVKDDKRAYAKVHKTDNFKLLQAACSLEAKRARRFSSLAAMQRWADKRGLDIDVYNLWETEKQKMKETRKNGN